MWRRKDALWRRGQHILGLNARNLLYVHGRNPRRHFPLADNKVLTKRALHPAGVPTPDTLAVFSSLAELRGAREFLVRTGEFVAKPVTGRQGGGILIISRSEPDRFHRPDGTHLSWDSLRRALADILFGVHSAGRPDAVIIERRIKCHAAFGSLGEHGLPDIRVILLDGTPAMAMMRVPTLRSGGRANLHQGALGVGLQMETGLAFRCIWKREACQYHPDDGTPMTGFVVPFWGSILAVARAAAMALPLPYLGVDIVVDERVGPVVMEVNARPGLEIQNVNSCGLRFRLEGIDARQRTRS